MSNQQYLEAITTNNAICEDTTQNYLDLQVWVKATKHLPK